MDWKAAVEHVRYGNNQKFAQRTTRTESRQPLINTRRVVNVSTSMQTPYLHIDLNRLKANHAIRIIIATIRLNVERSSESSQCVGMQENLASMRDGLFQRGEIVSIRFRDASIWS
jgi:hypothetical protein